MNQYRNLLLYVNQKGEHQGISQRELANHLKLSLGKTNALVKEIIELGYVKSKKDKKITILECTKKGLWYLEKRSEEKERKITLPTTQKAIKTAVILAAGTNKRFTQAVGMLQMGEHSLLERTVMLLNRQGIENILFVSGYRRDEYQEIINTYKMKEIVSDVYPFAGSMSSLALCKEYIEEDFLLIEIDYIFEEQLLPLLLNEEESTSLVLSPLREHGHERYVEMSNDNALERISSDVRQLNQIHGDLTGISKLSYPFYEKMCELYHESENILVNYEYIIERIAQHYRVNCLKIDDLICVDLDDETQYKQVTQVLYPMILKREYKVQKEELTKVIQMALGCRDVVKKFRGAGGMSNTNYIVQMSNQEQYVLRLSSESSSALINRVGESYNMKSIVDLDINVDTLYFDERTGLKIARYIEQVSTLSGQEAKMYVMMKKTSTLLRKLHESTIEFYDVFHPFKEIEKYVTYIQVNQLPYYDTLTLLLQELEYYQEELNVVGISCKPCHNDLVAENFILDKNKKMYLIDWEYSNMNDPMWDLAAHFIECNFTAEEEQGYLDLYFNQEVEEVYKQKVLLYKILQDILWSAWTIVKKHNGIDFKDYGSLRSARGYEHHLVYKAKYGKETT